MLMSVGLNIAPEGHKPPGRSDKTSRRRGLAGKCVSVSTEANLVYDGRARIGAITVRTTNAYASIELFWATSCRSWFPVCRPAWHRFFQQPETT